MNTNILLPEVQAFINKQLKTDITQLILKGSPFVDVPIKVLVAQIESKKKCQKKLPSWFANKNIYYPNKLNIEQTSSEATANYKATLISGKTMIDLTGGFGVDAFAFSKQFKKVTHCEINAELSVIVKHNAKQLNINNVCCFKGDGLEHISHQQEKYDWIYIDPSRRNELKEKVFLLKDCLPNIPLHLENLLQKSDQILIKNSPLIDITSCVNELKYVKEIHVIALQNEVKEVLVKIQKAYTGKIKISTANLTKKNQYFSFVYQKEYQYQLSEPLAYLYEPNGAILKSGGFKAISHQFNIAKLHQNSHLYTANFTIDFPGRIFKIIRTVNYNKKQILTELPNKKANITVRNFKESVANIRKKMGIKDGGDFYLFCTTNKDEQQIIIICKKI